MCWMINRQFNCFVLPTTTCIVLFVADTVIYLIHHLDHISTSFFGDFRPLKLRRTFFNFKSTSVISNSIVVEFESKKERESGVPP